MDHELIVHVMQLTPTNCTTKKHIKITYKTQHVQNIVADIYLNSHSCNIFKYGSAAAWNS